MALPVRPKRQRTRKLVNSLYDSRSIPIAIGQQRCKFNVLESFLKEKTSFFVHHGTPPIWEQRDGSGASHTKMVADTDNAKDVDVDNEGADASATRTGVTASPEKQENVPHFHITTRIYTPEAFEVFVDWLHNIPPIVPEDEGDCKSLLQAYVLAVQYDVAPLQNALIDCFRKYHVEATVSFDHLIWMVNNTGDNTALPMTDYLVQQIAYEIAVSGIVKYKEQNNYMPCYMKEGDRHVGYELVKAIAHRASSSGRKAGGPATSDAS